MTLREMGWGRQCGWRARGGAGEGGIAVGFWMMSPRRMVMGRGCGLSEWMWCEDREGAGVCVDGGEGG